MVFFSYCNSNKKMVFKDAELAQVMEGSIDYDPITPELYQRVAIVVASMCSQFCSLGYFSGDKKSQAQQQGTSRVTKNPKHNSLKLKSYWLAYQELIQVYFEATDVIINSIIVSQCSVKWTTTPVIID
ncbi:hypothetical protein C5167_031666 [Papaver somniferum]|uniref:Uncharacterized protein n=1 Tax=Papaver somniferum TaxID=3469 RepID=A0A4Y7I6V0_PAPSO|nr:hypothetical protein C5167_036378 [Papaver somniferum]RZC68440.1 hypothetical protein C5167_031666 [Papaver somniferum]